MIKSKALMILLILFIFTAVISLSAGANHDSETPSIYNQTDNNSDVSSMSDSTDNNSSLSVYNSTDGNSMNMSAHSTDGNPANVSSYNWTFGETEGPLQPIEFKKVPIDEAYSRDKLGNINVSDGTLEAFSRFGLWLEEQGVDAEAEDINIMYIDDDLRVIENYWVFATRPEAKELRIEKIENSKSTDPSSEEMITFLKEFDEKYPVKYVRTGLALFVTVENKEVLLSEISEEDIRMLEAIKNVLLEETNMNLKWGSSNPNIHLDMSGTASKKVGFNSYFINLIANNAAVPDDVSYIENIGGIDIMISVLPPFYIWNGLTLNYVDYLYLKNYNHYYNPTSLAGIGFGGAISSIENMYNNISISESKEEKATNLSYASHYMADLSMPLHTNYATEQALKAILSKPHFAYENDYVGSNWTSGHNFSQYSKNLNSYYSIQDLEAHSEYLANYSYFYSDEAW